MYMVFCRNKLQINDLQAFIKALVNIVTNEDKEIIGKKKSAAKKRLLRPIICICNDP